MAVTSTAFSNGGPIPPKNTCSGDNLSPQIAWSGIPAGTQAIAVIMDDPDAGVSGGFVHWVVFNLPAVQRSLEENVEKARTQLSGGALQGNNGSGKLGYTGPCPPPGNPHTYRFFVYALSAPLDLPPGATKLQVSAAMAGKILGQGLLMGRFGRAQSQ
ncbi:MAG: YbhB/YbcL family Raf kinase inhibitor-like protein [Dehalococcoidia bacterium]|nr:YbhB/YbcL family Raf kinase inhibitor-like protein [Dehalococcoidia bacterium]